MAMTSDVQINDLILLLLSFLLEISNLLPAYTLYYYILYYYTWNQGIPNAQCSQRKKKTEKKS